jgi:prepilin-type N-terminal cleavage/methylation domain-containing protein
VRPLIKPEYSKYRQAGFSLVEIAVVVAVIGILIALAIPAYKRSKDSTKIAAIENDLRIYEQDFETFELENKHFPPSQPVAGQFPVGMEEILPETWKLPSPIGGTYRWVYTTEDSPSERSAYIEIRNSSANPILLSSDRLREIDDDIDDGDPMTGYFVLSGLNIRYYIRL